MPSQSQMLQFIHNKDKSTLSKRYTPQQLEAAFKAMGGGAGGMQMSANTPAKNMGQLGQQAIEQAGSNLQGSGLGSTFNPDLIARASTGDMSADRARVEDALFSNLTRNNSRDKAIEMEALKQDLANRGITYSTDPMSRYQQEVGGLNQRYDDLGMQAKTQASILGGQEWERGVGINETIRQNQLGEQSGIRNQTLGELQGLAGIDALGKDYALKRRQLQIQQQALRRSGGTATTQESSPFNSTTPPGL